MNITIGVLAHVDAGKTTFSEQVLYHTHSIRTRGRVDHQSAYLDNHPIERDRGITIFCEQAVFEYKGVRYFLLDTPGHADFSAEMERALQAMDYAVLLISSVEGIQAHTETVWDLLRRNRVPTIFFLNKTDREGADPNHLVQQIRERFTDAVCEMANGKWIEQVAALDDRLLEQYLETGFEQEVWKAAFRDMFKREKLFPCFAGSALLDQGIDEFLQALSWMVEGKQAGQEPFQGFVYKIRHDELHNRITFLKVTDGILRVKEEIPTEQGTQKINEIRIYHGKKFENVQKAERGMLCGVTGLADLSPGSGVGEHIFHAPCDTVPLMAANVIHDPDRSPRAVLEQLRVLEQEDPLLKVEWNEALQEIQIQFLGMIQLEVLQQIAKQRFQMDLSFGDCQILYQETIAEPVVGYGHFEPLRHYAEVHLGMEPGQRGSGITFSSGCSFDVLDSNYQNLIRTHVFEKQHRGILTGSPLTDVKFTLLTGRAHNKHTEGGDFREAVYRAIRQGLEKAHNILLEPYYSFWIEAPEDCIGRVIGDIQKRSGTFDQPMVAGSTFRLSGRGPVACFLNYSNELASYTKGRGRIRFVFDGYDRCHNEEEIIALKGYDSSRDPDNTSDSVFCAKGAGFSVKWQDVERYLHCK